MHYTINHAIRTHAFIGFGYWFCSGAVHGPFQAQTMKTSKSHKPLLDSRTKEELMPLVLILPCLLLALVFIAVLVMLFIP